MLSTTHARTALAALLLAWQAVYANEFDTFGQHEDLKRHVIADAGDFEISDKPSGLIGIAKIIKLKLNCFEPVGSAGSWTYGKRSGLLIVNKEKEIKIALISTNITSIKIELIPVMQVSCTASESGTQSNDPMQQIQEIRRRQEAVRKEIERLRQQRQ